MWLLRSQLQELQYVQYNAPPRFGILMWLVYSSSDPSCSSMEHLFHAAMLATLSRTTSNRQEQLPHPPMSSIAPLPPLGTCVYRWRLNPGGEYPRAKKFLHCLQHGVGNETSVRQLGHPHVVCVLYVHLVPGTRYIL